MSNNNHARLVSIIPQVSWYGGKAIPALIVGPPGVAKTQFIQQLAGYLTKVLVGKKLITTDEQLEIATYVLPQTSPDALEGIAVPSEDRTVLNRLPLADLRRLSESKFGLMFGDELSSSNPETGAAFMTFASDGRAGDLKLHDRVARLFAMNPPECAAAGRELSAPEANRFCWIHWELPLADYIDYLRGGPGLLQHVEVLPEDWEVRFAPRAKLLIASFLENKRELVNELANGKTEMSTTGSVKVDPHKAWASQRSWENGARLMAACMSLGETMRSELCHLALSGCVGDNAAQLFFKWLADANMPDVEELLTMTTDKAVKKLPKRADHLRATLEQVSLAGLDKSVAGRHPSIASIKDAKEKEDKSKEFTMKRWHAAGELVARMFATDKDSAYSAMNMLMKVPHPLETKDFEKYPWLHQYTAFRAELGIS